MRWGLSPAEGFMFQERHYMQFQRVTSPSDVCLNVYKSTTVNIMRQLKRLDTQKQNFNH